MDVSYLWRKMNSANRSEELIAAMSTLNWAFVLTCGGFALSSGIPVLLRTMQTYGICINCILFGPAVELLIILAQNSHASTKKFNLTELLRANFVPRYVDRSEFYDLPMKKDITYLPEDDYLEEYEEKDRDELQQLDRTSRNLLPEYRNLCEIMTKRVQLDDSEYEYQPPHYYEVYCKNFSLQVQNQRSKRATKQKCAHPGFHCVQRSRTLFLLRRRWEGECWEPFTKEIASGCDCMWPVSILGDITPHY